MCFLSRFKSVLLLLPLLLVLSCTTSHNLENRLAQLETKVQDIEELGVMGLAEGVGASFYPVSGSLTGSGTGSLDKISGTADNDAAIAMFNAHGTYGNAFFAYTLDDNGGSGDNEPWYIESGDGGDERWELCDLHGTYTYSKCEISESDAATVDISSNESGIVYINTDGAQEYDLPADPTGYIICIGNDEDSTGAITIDPNGTDIIILDGAVESAGEAIVSGGAVDDYICLIGIDSTYWRETGYTGTWDGAVD